MRKEVRKKKEFMKAIGWLITGCSKGFGRELARWVADKGHVVIATVRNETEVAGLEALSKGKIKGWVLDVTEAEAENHPGRSSCTW